MVFRCYSLQNGNWGVSLHRIVLPSALQAHLELRVGFARITIRPSYPDDLDPSLSDLLKKLLTKDPKERIKLAGIKTHPWLIDNGVCILPSSIREAILVEQNDIDKAITEVTMNVSLGCNTRAISALNSVNIELVIK